MYNWLSWFYAVFVYTLIMHIIVDIRTSTPQDMIPLYSWLAWAQLWKEYKNDDTITFLIHDHQEVIADFSCLVVPRALFGLFWKKAIRQKSMKQAFRCVSFSEFAPYDTTIPTIKHVWSNAVHLYSDPMQNTIIWRYYDWIRRLSFRKATTIIVPDIQVGQELVELYWVHEEDIEIIPYLPIKRALPVAPLQPIHIPNPFFIYDWGYGNEANLLTLLAAWDRYMRNWWNYELIMIGFAGTHLSSLTQTIRSLDLSKSVRYLGYVDEGARDILYKNAKWWIYTWPYYSWWSLIEFACSYTLPLLLSDIVAFKHYDAIKAHPNHTNDIARALKLLENSQLVNTGRYHKKSYVEAYEKILLKRK